MKRFCLILAVCLLILSLTGCGSGAEETTASTASETSAEPSVSETTEAPTETTEATEPPTEPPLVVIGYDMAFPEGFEPSVVQDDLTVYLSPNAPIDESTVTVAVQECDESVLAWDEDKFLAQQNEETDLFVNDISTTEIDGFSAVFVDYTVIAESGYIRTLEYHVVATHNYVFTFRDCTDDNDWLEAYGEAVDTINFLLENEGISLDYSSLEYYDLGCGIGMYALPGLQLQDAEGFTACLGSHDAIILVMQDNKEANDLVGLSLQDYADLVSQTNALDLFTQDNYGSLQTSFYSSDETGMQYYNLLTVKETEDSFWVIQYACSADNQATYARDFSLSCSSVAPN